MLSALETEMIHIIMVIIYLNHEILYKSKNGKIFFSSKLYIEEKIIASKQSIHKNMICWQRKKKRDMEGDKGRIVEEEGVESKCSYRPFSLPIGTFRFARRERGLATCDILLRHCQCLKRTSHVTSKEVTCPRSTQIENSLMIVMQANKTFDFYYLEFYYSGFLA